jgi:hypothetical protein
VKTTIHNLKKIIQEVIEGTEEELDQKISHMDPDTIADDDYMDIETGEILLSKGEAARKSRLHPQYDIDAAAAQAERYRLDDLEREEWEKEDAGYEVEQERKTQVARQEFDAAVANFAESSKSYLADNPDSDADGIAMDLASSFFDTYPQWRNWSTLLQMSKRDMQEYIASLAYEAMIS